MSIQTPKFAESPFFVAKDGNWHLKEGAPEEVIKEFNEYLEYEKMLEERGIDV